MSFEVGDTISDYKASRIIGHDFLHNKIDEKNIAEKKIKLKGHERYIVKRVAYDAAWAYKLANFDWISDDSHSIRPGKALLIERMSERLQNYWYFKQKFKEQLYKENWY